MIKHCLIALNLGLIFLLGSVKSPGQTCKVTGQQAITICVPSPPDFTRCTKRIKVFFTVDALDWSQYYRYSVNIYRGDPRNGVLAGTYTSLSHHSVRSHLIPTDLQPISLAPESPLRGEPYTVVITVWLEADQDSKATTQISIVPLYKRKIRALLIGVSKYERGSYLESQSDISNLYFADADANGMDKLLNEFFPSSSTDDFRSLVLTNEKANKQAITDALISYREGGADTICENDLLIFYFSGHTLTRSDNATRYIGTFDVIPSTSGLATMGLSYDDLFYSYLSSTVLTADKVLILDSCFSGLQQSARIAEVTGGDLQALSRAEYGKEEVVDSSGIISRDQPPRRLGTDEQNRYYNEIGSLGGGSALYTAAEIDRPAQEGVVLTARQHNRYFQFEDEQTPSAASKGHGLFTYALFVSFEKQMAASHNHPDIAFDGTLSTRAKSPKCHLSFAEALTDATKELQEIQATRLLSLQSFGELTKQKPPTIVCSHLPKQ